MGQTNKGWRRRWFVMGPESMEYFEREGASGGGATKRGTLWYSKVREPEGKLVVAEPLVERNFDAEVAGVAVLNVRWPERAFVVHTVDREYVMRASSESEMQEWVDSINVALRVWRAGLADTRGQSARPLEWSTGASGRGSGSHYKELQLGVLL